MLQTNAISQEIYQASERLSERTVLESSNLKEIVESLSSVLFKLESLKDAEVDQLLQIQPKSFPKEGIDFYSLMELYEKSLIECALREAQGNQTRAAKLLNIQLSTLNKKIKRHQIQV
ncbi:MAG: helix-turn-helix domain-containing protein [Pyrinomonadaceae bacterium]